MHQRETRFRVTLKIKLEIGNKDLKKPGSKIFFESATVALVMNVYKKRCWHVKVVFLFCLYFEVL